MNAVVTGQEPLTDAEKDWLMKIYTLRRQNLFWAGVFRLTVFCIVFYITCFPVIATIHDNVLNGVQLWTKGNGDYLPVGVVLIVLTVSVICAAAYYSWILPYKLDALSGIKETIRFTVIEKQYFPVTGQYFLRFDGDDVEEHHEVTEEAYDSCHEGSGIFMSRAIKSQHLFHENDNVKVKLFQFSVRRRGNGYNGSDDY